jgi:hypothetical protein
MRALVALLLLANLAFLALAQGWLQPWVGLSTQRQREPQRMAAQIDPGAVRVLPASALIPPVAASCLQAGPFDASRIDAAEAALSALPAGSWQRVPADGAAGRGAPGYWLRVEQADAALQGQLLGLALPGAAFQPCAR